MSCWSRDVTLRRALVGFNSSWRPSSSNFRNYSAESATQDRHDKKINALSNFWIPSGGITASDENKDDPTSYLVKAGYIRQAHSGVFHFLPLGARQKSYIERAISLCLRRDLLASQVELSSLSAEDLWRKSGRIGEKPLKDVEHQFLTVADRKDTGYILSPTHEEEITNLIASVAKSYKEFPLRLFQIGKKYRDELRPRYGLLRTKEFVMKDLYTFDISEEAALQTYEEVRKCYRSLFQQLGLPVIEARASSGDMGGSLSHEFHILSPLGEDTLHICQSCGYAENDEVSTTNTKSGDDGSSCPQCASGMMSKHKAIEIGHTFHLGTRYSEPLRANVMVPRASSGEGSSEVKPSSGESHQIPLQMGCHGIGVTRLMGAAAAIFSDDRGLCWPITLSPFTAVVIMDKSTNDSDIRAALDRDIKPSSRQHTLVNFTYVVDDRDRPLAWKLKDADLVGYPITIVLGRKWRESGEYEVQCRSRPELSTHSKELGTAIRQILNAIDPDVQNGQSPTNRWDAKQPASDGKRTTRGRRGSGKGRNQVREAEEPLEATERLQRVLYKGAYHLPVNAPQFKRKIKAMKSADTGVVERSTKQTMATAQMRERVQLLEKLTRLQAAEERLKADSEQK